MPKEIWYSEPLKCSRCNNVAPMRIIGTATDSTTDRFDDGPPIEHGTLYEILSCPQCKGVTIRSGSWHDSMDREDWSAKVIYPSERQRIEGLPSTVENEYRAAEQVSSISPNAYAVLLGRVLDVVCNDRNASGNTLHERLSDLAARHEIPKNLADMAHKLRQLRNFGAHADLGALTDEEVPILAALCRAVLEYVYSAPRLVERVEKLIAKLKHS
jgi:Domain of unknown function (DUF4145)